MHKKDKLIKKIRALLVELGYLVMVEELKKVTKRKI